MTTTDKMTRRVIALRDRARHASTPEGEAAACLDKARELCEKYNIALSILDAPTEPAPRPSSRHSSTPQPEKRYPCRFGCSFLVQHTASEMAACAERRRNETGRESAYDIPPQRTQQRTNAAGNSYFNWDNLNDFFRQAGASTRDENVKQPKARATGSHAYCDHPATKAARAACRKRRAAGL